MQVVVGVLLIWSLMEFYHVRQVLWLCVGFLVVATCQFVSVCNTLDLNSGGGLPG